MAKSKRKKVESIRNLVSELPKKDVADKMVTKKTDGGTAHGTVIIGDEPPNLNTQNSKSVKSYFCAKFKRIRFNPANPQHLQEAFWLVTGI